MNSLGIPSWPYHSGHKPPVKSTKARRVEANGSVAFTHDITRGLPDEYFDCDVIYSELPWRNGMATYNKRAGKSTAYADFLKAMVAVVEEGRRTVYVTGAHALPSLPDADLIAYPRLNEWEAVALFYNFAPRSASWDTATEIILDLAKKYRRVGDPCCGYGRTLRLFAAAGRTFVGSDYNAQCIGYIGQHIEEWTNVRPK